MVKSNAKASEIRDWLTNIALVVSLGGLIFNFVLKPERNNLDLSYRIKAIEQRLDALQDQVNSRLGGIEKNVDRIWNRIK